MSYVFDVHDDCGESFNDHCPSCGACPEDPCNWACTEREIYYDNETEYRPPLSPTDTPPGALPVSGSGTERRNHGS